MNVVEYLYFKMIHLRSIVNLLLYKTIYGKKLVLSQGVYSRKSLNIQISENGIIEIGNNTFFNNYCSLNSQKKIKIGSECLFGENVRIYDHNHIFDSIDIPIRIQGFSSDTVEIGDRCWIGSNVTILKGVSIGENSVIGANSLIYQNIPPNSIVKSNVELVFSERTDS